jgi:hypothetical protein
MTDPIEDDDGHGAPEFAVDLRVTEAQQRANESLSRETYLGDGLYAAFDGHMITLRAPRPDGDHWVGLEPAVLAAFEEFVAKLREPADKPAT